MLVLPGQESGPAGTGAFPASVKDSASLLMEVTVVPAEGGDLLDLSPMPVGRSAVARQPEPALSGSRGTPPRRRMHVEEHIADRRHPERVSRGNPDPDNRFTLDRPEVTY